MLFYTCHDVCALVLLEWKLLMNLEGEKIDYPFERIHLLGWVKMCVRSYLYIVCIYRIVDAVKRMDHCWKRNHLCYVIVGIFYVFDICTNKKKYLWINKIKMHVKNIAAHAHTHTHTVLVSLCAIIESSATVFPLIADDNRCRRRRRRRRRRRQRP